MLYDYSEVTEISGDEVTREQIERLCRRYYWAKQYCEGKDILEVACGTGQGLGYLQKFAKKVYAGDICEKLVEKAKAYYQDRIDIRIMDALNLPFADNSLDVVILFEAIYYLPDAEKFVNECKRVLRSSGKLLIATANKDLYDFNPSKFSYKYFGVVELKSLLDKFGFNTNFFGDTPIDKVSLRQKFFRPIKKMASALNIIPKTMHAKKLLKRLVFGKLEPMPEEITNDILIEQNPEKIKADVANREYKVIYCEASLS